MKSVIAVIAALGLAVAACDSGRPASRIDETRLSNGPGLNDRGEKDSDRSGDSSREGSAESEDLDGELSSDAAAEAAAARVCAPDRGKVYKGFGGESLLVGRASNVTPGTDRYRVKPIEALSGELSRVVGSVPSSLEANRTSFALAPDRWYVEPKASAVTIFTTYRVAYEAGLSYAASSPQTAAAPTEQSATEVCTSFARLAWQQEPAEAQVAACKKVALVDTAGETDVKARWAYALASILTAAEFVNY